MYLVISYLQHVQVPVCHPDIFSIPMLLLFLFSYDSVSCDNIKLLIVYQLEKNMSAGDLPSNKAKSLSVCKLDNDKQFKKIDRHFFLIWLHYRPTWWNATCCQQTLKHLLALNRYCFQTDLPETFYRSPHFFLINFHFIRAWCYSLEE